jgi:hypothetical protein
VLAAGGGTGESGFERHQWCTTEFTHTYDERCFEQSALVEVFDERREALVKAGQQVLLQTAEDIVVGVPAVQVCVVRLQILSAIIVRPNNGNQRYTGFHKSACEQTGLS